MESVVRELVEYLGRAGSGGAESRLRAVLELLVHLAMADAGYIVDPFGRVLSRIGISAEEIEGVFSAERRSDLAPKVAATVVLPTIGGASPLSLVLCTRGAEHEIDLDFAVVFSVRITFAPLTPPLSVVRAA